MAKEIYLYDGIYAWSAQTFVEALEENKEDEIVARVNSGGGSVFDGYSIITKMQEHAKDVTIKVDGLAASMAFFMLLFADNVETNDVSEFMVHRASGYVSSEEDKKMLDRMNKSIRNKMESKIDIEKFTAITGKTMDNIFKDEQRIDVWLTAKQAKQVGLVDKVNILTAAEADQYKSMVATLAERKKSLESGIDNQDNDNGNSNSNNNHKFKTMTKAEFKAANPEGYAEILADGSMLERERVNTALVFLDADANAVKEIIASGEPMTTTQQAELGVKLLSKGILAGLENEGADPTDTSGENKGKNAEAAAAAKAKAEKGKGKGDDARNAELAGFDAEFEAELGLTSKND